MRLGHLGLVVVLALGLLGGARVAEAQPAGKIYRIGMLDVVSRGQNAGNLDPFRQGLRQLGYVEGQNLVIEYRSADGRVERFPGLAAELVRLKVDVIVTRGTPASWRPRRPRQRSRSSWRRSASPSAPASSAAWQARAGSHHRSSSAPTR